MARPGNAKAIGAYLEGKREAKARFQALPPFMQQKRIEVNSATAAAVVVGAQQRLASSPSIQTRNLYNHMKWSINKNTGVAKAGVTSGSSVVNVRPGVRKSVRVKGILIAGRGGSALTSKGAKLIRPSRYAHLVEFGTMHFQAEPFQKPSAAAQVGPHLNRWRAAGRDLERHMAGLGSSMPSTGGGLL